MGAEEFVKIKDHNDLVRDRRNGAILSVDKAAYAAAVRGKQLRAKERARIDQIENDIAEIKSSLKTLINMVIDESKKQHSK